MNAFADTTCGCEPSAAEYTRHSSVPAAASIPTSSPVAMSPLTTATTSPTTAMRRSVGASSGSDHRSVPSSARACSLPVDCDPEPATSTWPPASTGELTTLT